MTCTFSEDKLTELELMNKILNRSSIHDCVGPEVNLVLYSTARTLVYQALGSELVLIDLLNNNCIGVVDSDENKPVYALCVAHWLDICAVLGVKSRDIIDGALRKSIRNLCMVLYREVCDLAKLDLKELINMSTWASLRGKI